LEYEKVERINEIITVLTGDFLTHIGIEVIPTPANISVQKLIEALLQIVWVKSSPKMSNPPLF